MQRNGGRRGDEKFGMTFSYMYLEIELNYKMNHVRVQYNGAQSFQVQILIARSLRCGCNCGCVIVS
jgi:hypothetical protein